MLFRSLTVNPANHALNAAVAAAWSAYEHADDVLVAGPFTTTAGAGVMVNVLVIEDPW